MAEKFRFFDPVLLPDGTYDREYNAQEFTDYFAALVTTGVMKGAGNELKVTTSGSSMVTTVDTGIAFILGRYYENDSILTLTHDTEVLGKNRIDRIVVRLDLNTDKRYVKAFIKKGVASSSPVPPSLQRDNLVYEISLAQVKIIGGQTYINPVDITDERGTEDICPWAGSKILPNFDNAALEQLINDFNSFTANYYSLTDGINVKDRTTVDFNTITDTGFYWGNTFWGASNLPVSNVTFIVHVYRAGGYSGGPCVQVAYQADSNAGGKIYKRVRISGTWGQWEEVITGNTINANAGTIQYYVDGTLGTDSPENGRSSGASAWKTISYALNQLKKLNTWLVYLNIAAGTYNENVYPSGFKGARLHIRSLTTAPTINGTVTVQDCDDITLEGFTVNKDLNVYNSRFLLTGITHTASFAGIGILISGSRGIITNSTISNCSTAGVKADYGSHVYLNSVAGTSNGIGIHAYGSIVQRNASTITGTTPTKVEGGGQIW